MKTTFKNTIVAIASVALFAPLASANYTEIGPFDISDITGSIEGQTTLGGGVDELVNDINRANADQNANLRTSWTDSVNSVNVAAVYDLSAVTDQVTNLNTYIANEGNYKTILVGESNVNDAQILLDGTNLTDASNLATLTAGAYQGAQTAAASAQAAFDNVVANGGLPGEAEYDAALTSRDDAASISTALQTASNDANDARAVAQASVDASAARKGAIDGSISRSDARVLDANNAIITINSAVATKETSLNTTNTSLTAYSEGIYDANGNVNNLDTIITGLDATAADPDGLNYDPEASGDLPVADAGADTTTAYLADTLNDPQSVAAYVAEANTALASITSPITQAQKDALLNTVGNGAFEREAITVIAGDVVTLNGDATVVGSVDNKIDVLATGAVATNTAKVGVTDLSVAGTAAVTANTAKVGVTDLSVAGTAAVTANTAKVGVTNASVAGTAVVTANTAKVGVTNASVAGTAVVTANTAKVGVTDLSVAGTAAVTANTAKVGVTNASVAGTAAVTANTAKVGVTNASVAGTAVVTANTAKVGVTDLSVAGTAAVTRLTDAVFDVNLGADEVGLEGTITRNLITGEIHIGENSLVTNEVGGVQQLYATDAGGNAIDIDITNGSDLLINGDSVATELYADQGDAAVTAAFTAADAGLQEQITRNRADIDRNARGIAMVAALQHTTVLPGMTHALDLGAAQYEGETGLALNYSRRINENVQINFGAAATSDFDESVIKAGIGLQW